MRDFISIADIDRTSMTGLFDLATELKRDRTGSNDLAGKTVGLLFHKPSLRTRVSFEVAMNELGGHTIYLSQSEVGLGEREPISDIAQVLSRYVDAIVCRTFSHHSVEELARYATVPVINGLSDQEHPCQAFSDLLTISEKKRKLEGLTIAFIGDATNVASSLLLASALVGMNFNIASPKGYQVRKGILSRAQELASRSGAEIVCTEEPSVAIRDADVVYTDVWTSMGQEAEAERRRQAFSGYQVDARLLSLAKGNAIFMHPLPAHRGEEIAEGLLDAPQSVVFDQAENRLHIQKAILAQLIVVR